MARLLRCADLLRRLKDFDETVGARPRITRSVIFVAPHITPLSAELPPLSEELGPLPEELTVLLRLAKYGDGAQPYGATGSPRALPWADGWRPFGAFFSEALKGRKVISPGQRPGLEACRDISGDSVTEEPRTGCLEV
jgi:hypothetical protein